jgi:hypothetical protein
MKQLAIRIIILVLFTSCISIKPYERQYINDPEMEMSNDAGKNFNNYVYSIREGAIPAGSVEASGGCGCN